ncbi:MAG: hypothetical protein Q9227_006953 [Pyrenula ochraceoflavens]
MAVTEFQEVARVYTLLSQVPKGHITTYAQLASLLQTSPRAVGNALRNNPFAPEVPCHRVICADGYVGGFKGEFSKAPSGVNQKMKLGLLKDEGVLFDEKGWLIGNAKDRQEVWWNPSEKMK